MILVPLVALILHMQQTLARGDRSRCLRPGESVTRTVPLREAVLLAQCHLGCMEKVRKLCACCLSLPSLSEHVYFASACANYESICSTFAL